jgi:peptide chain release factor 1
MDQVVKRFELLEAQMAAGPAPDQYVKMASEYAELQDIVSKVRALRSSEHEQVDLRAMLDDKSQILLLPKDAADERNAILEIRAGTGGDEAALFAGDLFRMYERYAALKGWKRRARWTASEGEKGGYKEIIAKCRARACSPS